MIEPGQTKTDPPAAKEPQRALIEYWEYPWDGKKRAMVRVIESATDAKDAEKQFWRSPVWPTGTKTVSIQKTTWPDEV